MTDFHEVVTAVLAGEIHQFGEIVRRYDSQIKRFVAWFVDDAELREDVVQETFYKAFKSLSALSDPDQLESWLKSIARRCLVDQLRRRRRAHAPLPESGGEADKGLALGGANDASWVWNEVDQLEMVYREVLRRRYAACETYAEMARAMGVPESTVRGRLYEARKMLKQRLESKGLFP
ncbi:MAG TPA: sigma-70 family RNA polymerase sigma factor [Pirellulaceae bacterium]|nr:sigma-70 family RNA polymerase sigma factor [Pirellulaceae bacterium]